MVEFKELRIAERILLLRAFDYNVNAMGQVIDPSGSVIMSDEDPDKCLMIEDVMIISGGRGFIEVLDGTPTSISKFLCRLEEQRSGGTQT